ncbi:MAG TPA: four helix bundle protein [Candidatus Acidoferrales bacterium]|nr:four helix bundle protein [Candidatus Acidoferrales bacterium]
MQIHSYKDLIVWQKSILLVKDIFLLTYKFPRAELYGLVAQMRRAAISIPSNIAEGFGRKLRKEYRRGLLIAYASALELETQIVIAQELDFASAEDYQTVGGLLNEVIRMLNTLTSKLDKSPNH